MKKLLVLSFIIMSLNTYAGIDEVEELIQRDTEVQDILEEIQSQEPGWGGPFMSEPEITVVASSSHGGDRNGGNGSSKEYLVKIKYSVRKDWNSYSDTVFIFVSEWDYDALIFGDRKFKPASKGIRVTKIIESVQAFLEQ